MSKTDEGKIEEVEEKMGYVMEPMAGIELGDALFGNDELSLQSLGTACWTVERPGTKCYVYTRRLSEGKSAGLLEFGRNPALLYVENTEGQNPVQEAMFIPVRQVEGEEGTKLYALQFLQLNADVIKFIQDEAETFFLQVRTQFSGPPTLERQVAQDLSQP